jgi:UDP-N-acetyl-D-glucosamine dehydrogenase
MACSARWTRSTSASDAAAQTGSDLSYVVHAVEAVAATPRRGQLVILESTTYPATDGGPADASRRASPDVDFFLAFS